MMPIYSHFQMQKFCHQERQTAARHGSPRHVPPTAALALQVFFVYILDKMGSLLPASGDNTQSDYRPGRTERTIIFE